jgi:soluble lytic murein transglycosylase
LLLALLLHATTAHAGPTPILRALQAHDWTNADILAVQEADPIGVKLVQFERLLSPGDATAKEIADFLAGHPGWPEQAALRRRLAEALAADTDDSEVRGICAVTKPQGDAALLRCAEAERQAGHAALAQEYARRAWVTGIVDAAAEASFLEAWGGAIGPDEQWRRFDTLAWANEAAADRQLSRLDAAHQALGAARLAFRREDPHALDALAAVPAALRSDPILLLEQARYLRSQNDTAGALSLWRPRQRRRRIAAQHSTPSASVWHDCCWPPATRRGRGFSPTMHWSEPTRRPMRSFSQAGSRCSGCTIRNAPRRNFASLQRIHRRS